MTLQRTSESQLRSELELAGARFKGKAMHCLYPENHRNGDQNPSASVYCGKDGVWRWRCQACGKGGDVFDVMACEQAGHWQRFSKRMPGQPPSTKPPRQKDVISGHRFFFSYMAQKVRWIRWRQSTSTVPLTVHLPSPWLAGELDPTRRQFVR